MDRQTEGPLPISPEGLGAAVGEACRRGYIAVLEKALYLIQLCRQRGESPYRCDALINRVIRDKERGKKEHGRS